MRHQWRLLLVGFWCVAHRPARLLLTAACGTCSHARQCWGMLLSCGTRQWWLSHVVWVMAPCLPYPHAAAWG
jgi:hypothetical protein